jgi:DNA polymerase III delta subunit
MAKAKENDPVSELTALEGALARGLARGYALRGEERYFRERAITLLRAKAEALGHEVCLHEVAKESEGSDFRLARLIDDLSGGGLFAARRLVVVRQAGEALKKIEGEDSPFTRAALAFVQSADDVGTLVLSDPSLRADQGVVKALVAAGGLAPAFRKLWDTPPPWKPDPRQTELVLWIQRRARELGLTLAPEQAVYVGAATGNDLAALDDQLEMLRVGGKENLQASIRWTAGSTPWAVADHLLDGDLPRALNGIEALFHGGFQEKSGKRLLDAAALAILLVGALQRGASTCFALARSSTGAFGGSPQQREAALARAQRRAPAAWRVLQDEVARLERELKTGGGLDGNDFARLALRWAIDARPRAAAGARP